MYSLQLNSERGEYDTTDYNTVDIRGKVNDAVSLQELLQQFVTAVGFNVNVKIEEK